MTITAPTRITIEVHPGSPAGADGVGTSPTIRVMPDTPSLPQPLIASERRQDTPSPAPYDPGDCRCLDDEDCGADHAND
jgi:hypothetical protein